MQKYFYYLILLLPLIFISCEEEIDEPDQNPRLEPSLYRTEIIISTILDTNNVRRDSMFVTVYDGNENQVELKTSDIFINDVFLTKLFNMQQRPYYCIQPASKLKYELKTKYDCVFASLDGSRYTNTVTSLDKELYEIVCPSDHKKSDSLFVKWNSADQRSQMYLDIQYFAPSGNNVTRINIPSPASGGIYIPSSIFNAVPGIYKVIIIANSINHGVVNTSFIKGSSIITKMVVKKAVNII